MRLEHLKIHAPNLGPNLSHLSAVNRTAAPMLHGFTPTNTNIEKFDSTEQQPLMLVNPVSTRATEEETPAEVPANAWQRLMSYLFHPPSLNMSQALQSGKQVLDSLGKDYGTCLTPAEGHVAPEFQEAQNKAQKILDKVAGKALAAKNLDVKVRIYSSDRVDAFARRPGADRPKGVLDYVKFLKGGNKEALRNVELGITAGALNKLESEAEIAFLLAGEAAKALDGEVDFTINSLLHSQGTQVAADAKAFDLIMEAGYDPAQGLNTLQHLVGDATPGNHGLSDAIDAALDTSHHQGVRMALGQLYIENLRRTDTGAYPKAFHKEVDGALRLEISQQDKANPLGSYVQELAEDYATSSLECRWDAVPSPPGGVSRHRLSEQRWSPKLAGAALEDSLGAFSSLPPQERMNRGLGLLQAMSASGWERGGPPQLTVGFAEFLKENKGWSAEAFVGHLDKLAEESSTNNSPHADFVHQVMLNPGFQAVVVPLMSEDPEWAKLYDKLPSLLTVPRDGTPEEVSEQLAVATGILAGHNDADSYPMHRSWPSSLPMGEGVLDDSNREKLKTFIAGQQPGNRAELLYFHRKLDTEAQPWFGLEMQEVLSPSYEAHQRERDQLMARPLTAEGLETLIELLELSPLNGRGQAQLVDKLLSEDLLSKKKDNFTQNKTWGQLLGSALSSEFVPVAQKEQVFRHMLSTLPPQGLREGAPGGRELKDYLAAKTPLEVRALIELEVVNNGIGSPVAADGSVARHANPTMSVLGSHPEFSTQVAASTSHLQLDNWLNQMHSEQSFRLDSGCRKFLLDSMLAQQNSEPRLERWCERVNSLMDPYTLDLNPELKEPMQEYLVPTLGKMKPDELRTALHAEPVLEILSEEQTSEFLADALQPENFKGADAKLRQAIIELEKEFGLADKPTLKNLVYRKIAERAELQPGNVNQVLPNMTSPSVDMAKSLEKEIRGLSALVAATRTRSAGEQLATLDYLMGRSGELPQFFHEMEGQVMDHLSSVDPRIVEELEANDATLAVLMKGLRNHLKSANMVVRSTVASSFLAGEDGLMGSEHGRKFMLDTFLAPIPDGTAKKFARQLATAVLDAEGQTCAASAGYLLAQKPSDGEGTVSAGQVAHHIFAAYGVPGTKMEQYLAYTADFKEFEADFAASQDSAREMDYFDGLELIRHHYGDKWPANRKIQKIIGNGSVNVAVWFTDENTGEHGVVSMPVQNAQTQSNYDFHRLAKTVESLMKDPEAREQFGYFEGLLKVLKKSVSLEFNRAAAFQMQLDVEPFYKRKVGDWNIRSVRARSLEGDAIVMDLAGGKTARKILQESPEVYKSAMTALGSLETDALTGVDQSGMPFPFELHANADFHDGQVLIDEETKTVYILDFAQCVAISNEEREYALDVMTVIGKARSPEKAAEVLSARSGLDIPVAEMEEMMDSENPMDIFIKLVGYLANNDSEMPLSTVHWILMLNRRRALEEKVDGSYDLTLKLMGASHLLTGSLTPYNTARVAARSLKNVLGDLLHGAGAVATTVVDEVTDLRKK